MKKLTFKIISLSLIITHLVSVCLVDVSFADTGGDSFAPEKAIKNFYLDPYSGALSLSIPLVTPGGRQGVQPNLNLTYSSRNSAGPFGWGWNIDFFGYIERSTKKGVPKYDSTDAYIFSLGGVSSELVSIGGDEYRPKNQGNSLTFKFNGTYWKVTDKGGKIYYFGRNYSSRFVPPPNSYTSTAKVFRWKLDGIKDVNGNTLYLSYDYKKNFPTKIGYTVYQPGTDTYSAPSNAPFSVEFTTNPLGTTRFDKTYDFRSSGPNSTCENYITQMTVKAYPSAIIRKYLFDYKYSASSNRLLLAKITEQASDGSSMPPVTFTYQETPEMSYQVIPVSTEEVPTPDNLWNIRVDDSVENNYRWEHVAGTIPPELYPMGFRVGTDYYGMDWGSIFTQSSGSDKGVSWNTTTHGDLSVSGAQGSAFYAWTYVYARAAGNLNLSFNSNTFFTIFLNGNYANPFTSENDPYYIGPGVPSKSVLLKAGYNLIEITGYSRSQAYNFNLSGNIPGQVEFMRSAQATTPSLSGDFNGDGLDDIGTFTASSGKVEVALSNGSNFSPKQTWIENFCVNQRLLLGDFNGDAKTDICAFDAAGGNWRVALSAGVKFTDSGIWLSGFGQGLTVAAADLNADGKTDIAVFSQVYSRAAVQSAFSIGATFEPQGFVIDTGESDSTLSPGEFNGDGMVDFTGYKASSGGLKALFFYTGASVDSRNLIKSSEVIFGDKPRLFADFNGDGLTDAAYYDYVSGKIKVRPFNGASFSASTFDLPFDFQLRDASIQIQSGDYNGDGLQDFAAYNALGSLEIALSGNNKIPDLLSKVENGLGGVLELKYAHSDLTSGMPFVIPVLAESKVLDGRGNSYATTYSYSNGLYDLEDKEFRGFAYTKVTDAEGNTTESYFKQDDIYKSKLYKQEAKDREGKLYTKTENTWQHTQPYPGVYFPYLAETNSYAFSNSQDPQDFARAQQVFEYDAYGNITKIVSNGEKTQITEYCYNSALWLLSFPKHTYLLDQDQNKFSEEWFYYDNHAGIDEPPVKGLLTKEETLAFDPLAGTNSNIATQYAYDEYGNLTLTTDALGRITTVGYDASFHAYPLTTTNALGQSLTTTYDTKTGNLLTSTDPNGKVTTNVYDSLGQLIKVIGPLDTVEYPGIIYEYDLTSRPVKITKRIKADYAATPVYLAQYSFYDGLSRVIQEKSPAEIDPQTQEPRQTISGMVKFDSRGNIKEEYLPYFAAESGDFVNPSYDTPHITFTYDALGRLTRVLNADSTSASVVYSKWDKAITDENGHLKNEYHDAFGRVVKIEEHNQGQIYTTIYEYNALDDLEKITDNQGNITRIWYDSLGRKIQLDDPDMGIWKYEYDAVGNLIKQIDAKGQILEFQYDPLNRLIKKSVILSPQGEESQTLATYLYDDTAKINCVGRLSKVTDQSGSTEFFYDALGRETKTIKAVTGSGSFSVERAYDALSRPVTLKYPNGELVTYTYNPQGIERVAGALPYAANLDYSPTGQITKIQYGNGTETNYAYDPRTLRLANLTTDAPSGRIQDLNYQFDNTGNISQITDYVNTASQSFSYDDLNRLTRAVGSYGSFNYDYDSIGNMLHKEGVILTYGGIPSPPVGEGQGEGLRLPHAATRYGSTLLDYDANGNMIHKGASPEEGILLNYNAEDRLVKVEDKNASTQQTINITLTPGWNFFSLPLTVADPRVSLVLSVIEGKFTQVSRYNAETKSFEHYVGNSVYDDFDSFEFGRGYQIYITGSESLTLTLSGIVPVTAQATSLKLGYNLIFSPQTTSKPVEEALLPLQLGVDYSKVLYYDKATAAFKEYSVSKSEFTELKPGISYYLYSLTDALWTIPYSPEAVSTVTTFSYDGDGGRVKKILPSGLNTTYIGSLFEKDSDGSTRKHIFAGANRVATISLPPSGEGQGGGTTAYYHSDHLGSSNVITDATGAQVQHLEYTPYGSIATNELANPLTGSPVHHLFTDKELDNTGLYFFGARYYDPEIAHFISADSIVQAPFDPQTLNRYAYCRNNPLRYVDPIGYSFLSTIGDVLWGIGSAIAAPVVFLGGMVTGFVGGLFGNTFSPTQSSVGQSFASSVFNSGQSFGSAVGSGINKFVGGIASGLGNSAGGSQSVSSTGITNQSNQATTDSTGIYGKFTVSAKRGGGSSGMGSGWGHSWLSYEKGDEGPVSRGFWPGETATAKEAIFRYDYPGVLTPETPGLLDSLIDKADATHAWPITETQYNNLMVYINNFESNNPYWNLNVNCTDFPVGAARDIGIFIPDVKTFGRSDPNKLADYLDTLK